MEPDTRELRANAYRDGQEDKRRGETPMPWPWDDAGTLELAYLRGYLGMACQEAATAK